MKNILFFLAAKDCRLSAGTPPQKPQRRQLLRFPNVFFFTHNLKTINFIVLEKKCLQLNIFVFINYKKYFYFQMITV